LYESFAASTFFNFNDNRWCRKLLWGVPDKIVARQYRAHKQGQKFSKISTQAWAKMSVEEKDKYDEDGQGELVSDNQVTELYMSNTAKVPQEDEESDDETGKKSNDDDTDDLNINDYLPEEDLHLDTTPIDPLVSTAITAEELGQEDISGSERSLSAQFAALCK
jgi:hypothetical protein